MSIQIALRKQFAIDYRQKDAFDRLQNGPNNRVFAFESPKFKPGIRKFVAAFLRTFYLFYRTVEPESRNFYEIIHENTPCRLYFDLEYYKEFNKEVDPLQLLEDFLKVCIEVIAETLNFKLDRSTSFMLLDSSTEKKFSAHVIVHMPEGRLFYSNVAMKPLIGLICQKCIENRIGVVLNENGAERLLCDMAVYTKNRNFRLFQSSKCGKNSHLKLADYCLFYGDSGTPSNAKIFLDSLVIPKDYDFFELIDLSDLLKSSMEPKKNQASTDSLNLPILNNNPTNPDLIDMEVGRAPSPFPYLDEFMLGIFTSLSPQASIRTWRILYNKATNCRFMQYQLTNSRYCHNKMREHKSQNVYWSVNLNYFYAVQKCFDVVDCFRYESQKFFIPENLIPKIRAKADVMYALVEPAREIIPSESFNKTIFDEQFRQLNSQDPQNGKENVVPNSEEDIVLNEKSLNSTEFDLICDDLQAAQAKT